MSRSRAPLQATLNKHVNSEAVRAWIDGLKAEAEQITDYEWPDEPTTRQRLAVTALRTAVAAMRAALAMAIRADRLASDCFYDRVYDQDPEARARPPRRSQGPVTQVRTQDRVSSHQPDTSDWQG